MDKRFFLVGAAMILLQPTTSLAAEDLRDVVRTTTGRVILNTFNNCVRTQWIIGKDACAAEPHRAEISREERTIYFDFNKFALTQAAVQKLNSLAKMLTSDDQVQEAQIVGYADRIGTTSYNEQLSKRRAENVQRYLVSRGFIKSRVAETRWLGESAPVTQCPDSLTREELIACLAKDRRVEVEIEYRK